MVLATNPTLILACVGLGVLALGLARVALSANAQELNDRVGSLATVQERLENASASAQMASYLAANGKRSKVKVKILASFAQVCGTRCNLRSCCGKQRVSSTHGAMITPECFMCTPWSTCSGVHSQIDLLRPCCCCRFLACPTLHRSRPT